MSASMGPQLDSCGRTDHVRALDKLRYASMGPQLDSCGRSRRWGTVPTDVSLQWGRNLIVAEGTGTADVLSGIGRFNGAAT